jgi:outer membrane immunogenic protein
MRTFAFGLATLVGLIAAASAADLRTPVLKAAPPAVPVWSWTGCYAGGHAGYLRGESQDWTPQTPGGAYYGVSLGSHDLTSWIGGVQAGCDYQFAGGFVVGAAGDYAWTDAVGEHDSTREIGVTYHSKIKSLASITGRLGYGWDRFLGYVKGGAAWQRDEYWATTTILGTAYVADETRRGWTLGVGGEYAFSNALSVFVEYNYYDFGNREIALTPQLAILNPAFVDIKASTSVVKAGVNFRFGY